VTAILCWAAKNSLRGTILLFSPVTFKTQKKNFLVFFWLSFLCITKDKKSKEVKKIKVFLTILLDTEGSGSGSVPPSSY